MALLKPSGIPTSPATVSAISSTRTPIASWIRWRNLERSSTGVVDQLGNAALAAATAASTSAGVPSGIEPMTCSVDALITSMVLFPVDGTKAPPM